MENIKKAVNNVMEESEKINYDPTKDTNWCQLPMEMRMECIRKMDFKTRTRLSVTSEIEKSLVESEKYHFTTISLIDEDDRLRVAAVHSSDVENMSTSHLDIIMHEEELAKKVQFLRHVLKTCEVHYFVSMDPTDESDERERIDFETDLADLVPFSFKTMTIAYECCGNMDFLLDNCPNLEAVSFCHYHDIARMLDHPTIINVRELRIVRCDDWTALFGLLKKWIEMDAQVGKSVQFSAFSPGAEVLLPDVRFVDRVIKKTYYYTRIRMDDPTKQILMRYIGTDPADKNYYSCKVVPMDLPESEYGKYDEWITGLLESVEDVDEEDDSEDE